MKIVIAIGFIIIYSVKLSFGQVDITSRRLFVNDNGIFINYCLNEISKKYNILTETKAIDCISLTKQEFDSIQHNNAIIIKNLSVANGDKWYEKFQSDLSKCQSELCPYDSLRKFYSFGIGGSIILNFSKNQNSLGDEHKCLLKYTLIPTLLTSKNIKLDLLSHSTPNELDVSLSRAIDFRDYLAEQGIDIRRIRVIDKKTTQQLKQDPENPVNRRIELRITSF